jgi:hypothetical protein
MQAELVTRLAAFVHSVMPAELEQLPLGERCSLDAIEALARALGRCVLEQVLQAWKNALERAALEVGRECPGCGHERKCKTRPGHPMRLELLGVELAVPKLYLECDRCEAPGVSITRLLTGLSSGDTSAELELMAGYCAAQQSYGKASAELGVHHGRVLERTAVRRLALEVERHALMFAEAQRRQGLERVGREQRQHGPARLMFQGDGGVVRTATLEPCERGDPGYGKKTSKTGRPRRKRATQFREIITLDVREPGETVASALDVVVPVVAPEGERSRRILALAARRGLGDNTQVFGLGDMGSSLAESFDEAFVGYEAKYSADWKHTSDYVRHVAAVLVGIDAQRWTKAMKDALWHGVRRKADALIERAREHRVAELPVHLEKCPVHALRTYVTNNWGRFNAKSFKQQGLDFVSGRAEAQVRERTKPRFRVPGAWRHENLEGKAVLRAIIADGRWPRFREHYLKTRRDCSQANFQQRLEQAVSEGRVRPLDTLNAGPDQDSAQQHAA